MQATNALARHSLAPSGRVARRAGGARFFACPQPQPHLRAGGVSTPQTGRSERLFDAGADDDARVLLLLGTTHAPRWRAAPAAAPRIPRRRGRSRAGAARPPPRSAAAPPAAFAAGAPPGCPARPARPD